MKVNMKVKKKEIEGKGIRFSVVINNKEVGRAFLYILYNDLHKEPFGFLEDVYIDENLRGRGIGTKLLNEIIEEARKNECYKIVATSRHSRPEVHKLYERIGFRNRGIEFRLDF
jgi:GNAT superfamily N-acetyltransferase